MTQTVTVSPQAHRFRALARANEIRTARAELKRQIASGERDVAEVILDPPLGAVSWSVGELLGSQRGWGEARVRRFLVRNRISERKPIGELTQRQRQMLAAQLGAVMALTR